MQIQLVTHLIIWSNNKNHLQKIMIVHFELFSE